MRRDVEDIFLGLGYEIVDGREVETTRYNFDALGFPDVAPGAVAARHALSRRADSPPHGDVAGADPQDGGAAAADLHGLDRPRLSARHHHATHYPIFHQFEGLAIDKGITLADLKGTLLYVMRQLYGPEREVRFRTHYFPFTEPSMEGDVSCFNCGGAGCAICKHSGWIELGGSGMVDPYLYEFVGWGPEEYTRLRVRPGHRADGAAPLRHLRHSPVLGERPALPEPVPMKIPAQLAARVRPRRRDDGRRSPRRSRSSTAEVEGVERVGVPGELGLFRVGHVLEAEKHPDADRLQLTSVDVGEDRPYSIVCGAWNFGAGAKVAVALPGATLPNGLTLERRKLRGQMSEGMILAEDELDLGTDHSGIIVLDDALEAGTPLVEVLPLVDEVHRPRGDREPRRPVRRLRRRARGRGVARRRAPADAGRGAGAGRRRGGRHRDRRSGWLPALHRPGLSATSRSASHRYG